VRGFASAIVVLLLGCGGTGPAPRIAPTAPARGEPRPATEATVGPRSAMELVTVLREIVAGTRQGVLEDHVDQAFAERLASGDELDGLFRGWPEDCVPRFDESGGYAQVAIPPPFDDDPPEDVARIEAIIAELRAATEVSASCEITEVYQEGADEPATTRRETLMLFAIAARPDGSGIWRAMAWRNFRTEDPMAH
jgi:hypothetical protein